MTLRYESDYEGWGQILKSSAVQALVTAKAERVRNAAGPGFVVESGISAKGDRASARVYTATHAARVAEADQRALSKAFGSIVGG